MADLRERLTRVALGRYTVWCEYGTEGWKPHPIESLAEVPEVLRSFSPSGWRVTRDIDVLKALQRLETELEDER